MNEVLTDWRNIPSTIWQQFQLGPYLFVVPINNLDVEVGKSSYQLTGNIQLPDLVSSLDVRQIYKGI